MSSVAGTASRVQALGSRGTDWERVRFASSIAIYGASVGASTVLVNLLSRVVPPQVPQHLPATQAIYFGSLGAVVSLLIVVPIAWFIYGGRPVFTTSRRRGPRGLMKWLALGSGYAGIHMLVLGALFLPMGNLWFSFIHSNIDFLQFLYTAVNNLFMSPYLSVTVGLQLLYTSILSVVVFGVGAALIDRINASADPKTALFGAWTASLVLSAALMAFVVLAPATTLASLGRLVL